MKKLALAPLGVVAACTTLDPIVGPDGMPDDVAVSPDVEAPAMTDASRDGHLSGDASVEAPADGPAEVLGAPDASDAGTSLFTCGTKTCNAGVEYCHKAHDDAGTEMDTCIAYPSTCTADGGMPTCGCIAGMCTCAQTGDAITITCP